MVYRGVGVMLWSAVISYFAVISDLLWYRGLLWCSDLLCIVVCSGVVVSHVTN